MEWNSSNFGMEIQSNELNCTPEQQQLSNSFFNPNWDNSMDQGDPFESALSSIVSSPAASSVAGGVVSSGESFVLRELIGRLGSICKSGGEVTTPKSYTGGHNSTNNSCYTTPLNSPPKLNLSDQIRGNFQFPFPHNNSSVSFLADPGFTERAARFSQFGLNETEFTFPARLNHPVVDECGNLSNSGSEKKFRRISRSSTPPENREFGDSRENSSVSEQIPVGEIGMKAQNIGIGRKRKSIPRGKGKETPKSSSPSKVVVVVAGESEESNSKRNKSDDENGKEKEDSEEKEEQKGNGKSREEGKENEKTQEPPKDYIHVRARRGQATDSHSLAERVRREKISERMKFLQDLVPGCNKVTGKAVMLDEIINYVQSLQRQVEFLSMKLSTVNPSMDFNMEALLSKNILQSGGSMAHSSYPIENSAAPAFPYGYQSLVHSGISNGMDTSFSMKPLPHIDGFREAASQASTFWEDDLQSFVQMGFNQNQQQGFSGAMATTHMKVEL